MIPSLLEYLPQEHATALVKLAEEPIKHPLGHALKTVGKGALGLGLGMPAGYAIGELASTVIEKTTGKKLTPGFLVPAATLVGAGLGMAYSLYKSKENEELQRAYKAHRDNAARRIPGK